METMTIVATTLELGAAALLAWLLWRGSREREVTLGAQRAALETLRADLAALVADAEARGRALDEALGAREARLRTLVGDADRVELPPPRKRAARAETRDADPAEARLRRELEMRFAETAERGPG